MAKVGMRYQFGGGPGVMWCADASGGERYGHGVGTQHRVDHGVTRRTDTPSSKARPPSGSVSSIVTGN